MFTTAGRQQVLDELIARARTDPAIAAAAVVGSGARRDTDRWSDIDLALRLEPAADPLRTAEAWSAELVADHEISDHLDLWAGTALYRVFLLADSLQVDLSFWPDVAFASNGEPWQLVFGEANPESPLIPTPAREVVGWAWLYALHTRSALARGRWWQAVQMLDGLRDRVITLACRRHGLPDHQGRGVDRLPAEVLGPLDQTLVSRATYEQLHPSFVGMVGLLLSEIAYVDHDLAERLRPPLGILVETVRNPALTVASSTA